MIDGPRGQLVPLVGLAPVDGEAQLGVLVLGLLQVLDDLVDELAEEPAADEVVRLHEDLAQARLADRVVLRVELVEAVKCVAILK